MATVKTVEAGLEEKEMRAEKVNSSAALRVQLAEVGAGGGVDMQSLRRRHWQI